jgi:hypothetical protein
MYKILQTKKNPKPRPATHPSICLSHEVQLKVQCCYKPIHRHPATGTKASKSDPATEAAPAVTTGGLEAMADAPADALAVTMALGGSTVTTVGV